jgi:DNA-directed RNA polymerase, mitochondrial
VILEVFNSGGNAKLDVPEPPSELPPLPTNQAKNEPLTNAEKFDKFKEKMAWRRAQAEMYSLRCDALYRLSLANYVSCLFFNFFLFNISQLRCFLSNL